MCAGTSYIRVWCFLLCECLWHSHWPNCPSQLEATACCTKFRRGMDGCLYSAKASYNCLKWLCPSFRRSRQVHCIASCKLATFRIRGNLYSWSRQVVKATCHFFDSGRILNRSSGLQVWCEELGDMSPYSGPCFLKRFSGIYRQLLRHLSRSLLWNPSQGGAAAPCSLSLSQSPGLICTVWVLSGLAFPAWGAAGVRNCDYWMWWQLCCSHLSKSYFPSTLGNIAQTAFHGLERFQLQGEPVAASGACHQYSLQEQF